MFFKSTVYHLHHDHETYRDPDRFILFDKFKAFSKGEWLNHLEKIGSSWGLPVENSTIWDDVPPNDVIVNESLIKSMISNTKPLLTVCIVSYRRWDTLIDTLKKYISSGVKLNLFLWLNSCDDIPLDKMETIRSLCTKFFNYDVTVCKSNMGTGHPRNIMLSRSYRELDTPYIMTVDDDIQFNTPEEIMVGASILENIHNKRYGSVGIWCIPTYEAIHIDGSVIQNYKPHDGFQDVDALGAAAMTIRRDVLSGCNTDPNYKMGLVDWDFSMTIKKDGWKLGLLCDDRYKPLNFVDGGDDIYKSDRGDKGVKKASENLFIKKWGLTPLWRKKDERGVYGS